MIRLMIKTWSKADKIVLRDALANAYKFLLDSHPYYEDGANCITKAFANCISWLEDDIAKM